MTQEDVRLAAHAIREVAWARFDEQGSLTRDMAFAHAALYSYDMSLDRNASMKSIAGYTDQSDSAVDLVNYNKQVEEMLLRMCDALGADMGSMMIDKRWLAVARTHFEQGFMAMNRAVFQPQRAKITTSISIEPDK